MYPIKCAAACVLSSILLVSCAGLQLRDADEVPVMPQVKHEIPENVKPDVSPESELEPEPDDMIRDAFGEDNVPAAEASADVPAQPMEKAELTDPFAGTEITVTACGDNLIHPNIYMDASYRKTAEKAYDFLPMYKDVAFHIAGADLAFINQETVMAGDGYANSGYPTFNSPQQLGLDLVELGFDIIGIAN
ncbi:MAG: CapA family protein, partial [Clostridia bacterium]|nr:CapA family protein [Clostridia bacterium]